jgi:hypothetical protein
VLSEENRRSVRRFCSLAFRSPLVITHRKYFRGAGHELPGRSRMVTSPNSGRANDANATGVLTLFRRLRYNGRTSRQLPEGSKPMRRPLLMFVCILAGTLSPSAQSNDQEAIKDLLHQETVAFYNRDLKTFNHIGFTVLM